jgi:hypothetical protein
LQPEPAEQKILNTGALKRNDNSVRDWKKKRAAQQRGSRATKKRRGKNSAMQNGGKLKIAPCKTEAKTRHAKIGSFLQSDAQSSRLCYRQVPGFLQLNQ